MQIRRSKKVTWKLWSEVHSLAMAISFWKKKKDEDPTCPGLLWSHRVGDNDHPGCTALPLLWSRGLYPRSEALRCTYFFRLLPGAQQLWKRHTPHPHYQHCWVFLLKLNLKHSTKVPDVFFSPSKKISLHTPARHPTGRHAGCWDPGAPRQQHSIYTGHSNSSSSHFKKAFMRRLCARCWGGGWVPSLCSVWPWIHTA